MAEHEALQPFNPLGDGRCYICTACQSTFATSGKLAQHWARIHTEPPRLDLSAKDREFLRAMRIADG